MHIVRPRPARRGSAAPEGAARKGAVRKGILRAGVLLAAVGLALPVTALPASAAADRTPPTLTLDQGLRLHSGSTAEAAGAYALVPVTARWTESDASGICAQTTTLVEYPTGDERVLEGVRTSVRYQMYADPLRQREDKDILAVRVRVTDCAGNTTEQLQDYSVALAQETDATLSGGWAGAACGCWLGGHVARSTHSRASAPATATYTSTGNGFALVTDRGPGRGTAEVLVDGVQAATLDTRGPVANRLLAFSRYFPTAGRHTVTVRVTSGRVDVDAFLTTKGFPGF